MLQPAHLLYPHCRSIPLHYSIPHHCWFSTKSIEVEREKETKGAEHSMGKGLLPKDYPAASETTPAPDCHIACRASIVSPLCSAVLCCD